MIYNNQNSPNNADTVCYTYNFYPGVSTVDCSGLDTVIPGKTKLPPTHLVGMQGSTEIKTVQLVGDPTGLGLFAELGH